MNTATLNGIALDAGTVGEIVAAQGYGVELMINIVGRRDITTTTAHAVDFSGTVGLRRIAARHGQERSGDPAQEPSQNQFGHSRYHRARGAHTFVLAMIAKLLAALAVCATLALAPTARADQVIEQCHWDQGVSQWVYDAGSLCRGTGEFPTHDGYGRPVCANGRMAVLEPSGRVMCVVASL